MIREPYASIDQDAPVGIADLDYRVVQAEFDVIEDNMQHSVNRKSCRPIGDELLQFKIF